ncbi:MAG: iron ABC transporter permease [Candidatus Hydrogenedentes bacterium]|nr:iron ABC transporter permease [Candidatus Hydrogenedentota bacterium]
MRERRASSALVVGVALVSVGIVIASLTIGTETLSFRQAWVEWRQDLPMHQAPTLSIIVQQRLPRTLAALIAGAGLALAGCVFQAMLRNPLATPYTLGIASAGALGAWVGTIVLKALNISFSFLSFSPIEAFSFLFAGLDMLLIYLLATRHTRMAPSVLLLAGVTLGMLANAGIMLMRYLAHPELLVSMERWLMGGVDVLGYEPVTTLLVGVTPCALVLLAQAAKFDQLGFGAELAAGRGVNVNRLQLVTFGIGSLMTAIIVSKVGPIGFIGLIVPHAVRGIAGSLHRVVMPLSVIVGGAFLCCCDIVARKLLPGETPVGIVTSLIGGPFFLYLLMRRKFTDWEV